MSSDCAPRHYAFHPNFFPTVRVRRSCTSCGRDAGWELQETSIVFRVVSTTMRQSSQCSRCRVRFCTRTESSSPSKYSERSFRTCLQVKGINPLEFPSFRHVSGATVHGFTLRSCRTNRLTTYRLGPLAKGFTNPLRERIFPGLGLLHAQTPYSTGPCMEAAGAPSSPPGSIQQLLAKQGVTHS